MGSGILNHGQEAQARAAATTEETDAAHSRRVGVVASRPACKAGTAGAPACCSGSVVWRRPTHLQGGAEALVRTGRNLEGVPG
jgi:hypothetical protein